MLAYPIGFFFCFISGHSANVRVETVKAVSYTGVESGDCESGLL